MPPDIGLALIQQRPSLALVVQSQGGWDPHPFGGKDHDQHCGDIGQHEKELIGDCNSPNLHSEGQDFYSSEEKGAKEDQVWSPTSKKGQGNCQPASTLDDSRRECAGVDHG